MVVGGGFAGITLVRALKRTAVDVLLLDRNNYHLFTPLLYQVGAAMLDPSQIAEPIRAQVRPLRNVEFRQAVVEGFDFSRKRLLTDHGPIEYDRLVLAAGSATNHFGLKGMEERSYSLKELPDGLAVRNHVLEQLEEAQWEADGTRRERLLTFVVVGGGPTGVEMAGALSELIHLVLPKDYPRLDLTAVRVVLLEAAPSLLGAFAPSLREAAARSLRGKDVEVRLSTGVKEVTEAGVVLADGTVLEAATVIWTAGVRASDLAAELGVEVVRQGRVPVDSELRLAGHEDVWVIGDMAALEQGGETLPMLIPVAMQEAKHVARVIAASVEGRIPAEFRYRDPGIMATIGRNSAVAQLGRVHLSGFPGWVMWLGVHLVNVVSLRNRLVVLVSWAWDYFFYDRPVRLVVRARR